MTKLLGIPGTNQGLKYYKAAKEHGTGWEKVVGLGPDYRERKKANREKNPFSFSFQLSPESSF